jgi:hypothetical protein
MDIRNMLVSDKQLTPAEVRRRLRKKLRGLKMLTAYRDIPMPDQLIPGQLVSSFAAKQREQSRSRHSNNRVLYRRSKV